MPMLGLRVVLGHLWEAIIAEENRGKDIAKVGEQEQGMWQLGGLHHFPLLQGEN